MIKKRVVREKSFTIFSTTNRHNVYEKGYEEIIDIFILEE